MSQRIAAVIPTFNEVELLTACVDSLLAQNDPDLVIVVVNAGEPLPAKLTATVTELKVPSDYFWTACIDEGVKHVKEHGFDLVMFTNADTTFLPGSVSELRKTIEGRVKAIACSPAYIQTGDEPPKLLYSDQRDFGILLFGKIVKRWEKPVDAPNQPFAIQLTGGQGVLMPMDLFDFASMDVKNLPHYASDHDLWLQARKLGYTLLLAPKAGIVNRRQLNETRNRKRMPLGEFLWKRHWSLYTPDSWTVIWRVRRKHQGPILGFVSAVLNFGVRWTLGLPKILRSR
jgi:GT2 family glycosyltransferase